MDEKISLEAVETYSAAFATKVAESFFKDKAKISGKEILSLCEPRQINLFVIRELLKAWRQETQKYKSPYFDYSHQDVKNALTQFQNILSNHISIGRDHFIPLLKKATGLTVYLILDPYDFYSDTLDRDGKGVVKTVDLKDEIKYIKINKAPLEKLAQKLESKKIDTVTGNEAFALLDHILEEVNFTPEDVEQYIAQLSKTHPLNIDTLYYQKEKVVKVAKVETGQASVNDMAQQYPISTVADNFQKIPLLKERLTINQKFMFTKILFNGDFDLFNNAVTQIDKLATFDEATSYLDSHYSNWDRESEEYEEFIELITKRFS